MDASKAMLDRIEVCVCVQNQIKIKLNGKKTKNKNNKGLGKCSSRILKSFSNRLGISIIPTPFGIEKSPVK